ncbi:hypothetical protein Fmac_010551 [Flemingia macrophylla]|uniref:Uncharacterized protein n=1 Tax=Flemingia macrophylla TaxID=520843 RepID=A0ABD1MJW8_9FABA
MFATRMGEAWQIKHGWSQDYTRRMKVDFKVLNLNLKESTLSATSPSTTLSRLSLPSSIKKPISKGTSSPSALLSLRVWVLAVLTVSVCGSPIIIGLQSFLSQQSLTNQEASNDSFLSLPSSIKKSLSKGTGLSPSALLSFSLPISLSLHPVGDFPRHPLPPLGLPGRRPYQRIHLITPFEQSDTPSLSHTLHLQTTLSRPSLAAQLSQTLSNLIHSNTSPPPLPSPLHPTLRFHNSVAPSQSPGATTSSHPPSIPSSLDPVSASLTSSPLPQSVPLPLPQHRRFHQTGSRSWLAFILSIQLYFRFYLLMRLLVLMAMAKQRVGEQESE